MVRTYTYLVIIFCSWKKFVPDYFGGISKTARALGIKPPTVFNWTDPIPFSAIGRIVMVCPKAYNVEASQGQGEERRKFILISGNKTRLPGMACGLGVTKHGANYGFKGC